METIPGSPAPESGTPPPPTPEVPPTFSAPPPPPPPPRVPPPPVIGAPQPAKPRRSYGWMITCLILAVLLGMAALVILAQSVTHNLSVTHGFKTASAREVGPKLEECVLEENNSHNKIAVISVDGVITSHQADEAGNNLVDVIKAQLDKAADDVHVKAVILKVDSPGGEVMASDQIYKAIAQFEMDETNELGKVTHQGKPVICSMGSLAASGGYYISAPCRWIVADELTLTGSIGVIMHGINYRGLMDKVGIAPMTFKSGKFKDMLSPDRATNDIPAEEHEMVQGLIMETYEKFKGVVADGRDYAHELNSKATKKEDRGRELADNWEDFADGRVMSGTQAQKLGLVDELGDFDTAVERALTITGMNHANLVEYREKYDLSNFLSMFGQSGQAKDIKLDLGLEIPKLRPGCLYYLWQAPQN